MSERQLLTVTDWVVERRPSGWFYTTYHNRKNKREYKGPYSSEASVSLMIARQIRREIIRRT